MNTKISVDSTDIILSTRPRPAARVQQKEDPARVLLRNAKMLQSLEPDPIRNEWFVGYVRGLLHAMGSDKRPSPAEHKLYLIALKSDDLGCAALGRGYLAGMHLDEPYPT